MRGSRKSAAPLNPSSKLGSPRYPGPGHVVASLRRNRGIVFQMAKRDMIERYRGSVLGFLWSVLNPLLMLVVYTFVFTVIFRSGWPGGGGSSVDFAVNAFAGITVFNIFAESVARAPVLVVQNANLVKKVVFPLEILPWVTLASSLFHALVNFAVLLAFVLAVTGKLHATAILFPLAILPVVLATLGLSWFLAALGVFFRDASHTVALLVTVLMFVSPVFYPVSAVPAHLRPLYELNPLARSIEDVRAVVVSGTLPDPAVFLLHCLVGAAVAWGGLWLFMRTKHAFADVL
jgi:lipopolysaccharide transport system permease protein